MFLLQLHSISLDEAELLMDASSQKTVKGI